MVRDVVAFVAGELHGFPAALTSFIGRAGAVREAAGLLDEYRLLVLDNCEHVIGAAAGLRARLLAACDDVRVLAASRGAAGGGREARYRLGSLTLPDDDPAGSEAVTLFADPARSADAHFALDDQTGPAVVRLVRRPDGMPLAIELVVCEMSASAAASCCPGSPACIFL
jgi:predicted ATPase